MWFHCSSRNFVTSCFRQNSVRQYCYKISYQQSSSRFAKLSAKINEENCNRKSSTVWPDLFYLQDYVKLWFIQPWWFYCWLDPPAGWSFGSFLCCFLVNFWSVKFLETSLFNKVLFWESKTTLTLLYTDKWLT